MSQINQSQMLPIGVILGGRYRIERYMASGGFGNTYEVVHTHLGQRLAVKEFFMTGINHRGADHTTVLVSNDANRQDFTLQMEKFRREAQRLSQLHHPNIVQVTDLFDANGTSYYVMELIQGEALSTRLKRGPLTEAEARHVLEQLLGALETVHAAGLTHLDIKPENIMVDRTGHATLIDFGASKQMSLSQRTSMSISGMAYTPGYAPYEQVAQMTDKLGPWTDFYAVGATMYHLLTGQKPPEVEPSTYRESTLLLPQQVSMPMRQFIFRMMNPDRLQRPQTVNQVRALLTASPDTVVRPQPHNGPYQPNDPITQKIPNNPNIPNTPITPRKTNPPRESGLSKALPYIIALAILGLIILGGFLLIDTDDEPDTEKTPPEQVEPKNIEDDDSEAYSEFPYDNCGSFHDGLAPAQVNGKWGFVNKDWQWVVKPRYDKAYDFSEGMAVVMIGDKAGFIDKEGSEAIPVIFEDCGFFKEGLAKIRLNGKTGFINRKGERVVACKYDRAWDFSDGLAPVMSDGKWGYIDKDGDEVIELAFSDADSFHDGYARVNQDYEWALIDKSGDIVFLEPGAFINACAEGFVSLSINDKYGIATVDGDVIVDFKYNYCDVFKNGLATIELNGKWGFIDKDGTEVIPPRYDDLDDFSEGLCRVKSNGKWGFIDKGGDVVIPIEYDDAGSFSEGLAFVKKDGKYGFIDKNGNMKKIKVKK